METIDDLIQLHTNNIEGLVRTRGVQSYDDQWVRGTVKREHLIQALRNYSNDVGILLYNYHEEFLIITLVDKYGETATEKLHAPKEELVDKINKTNQYFACDFISRSPHKRGLGLSIDEDRNILQDAYEYVSEKLLPFSLDRFDHIIIVPTLNIGSLPFSVLKDSQNQYLIDKISYSIAPSVYELLVSDVMNVLLHDEYVSERSESRFYDYHLQLKHCLFVADPKYPSNTEWTFPTLPGTLKEVAFIEDSLGEGRNCNILKGEAATHETIMDGICRYDLLYFGTHGISDSENPLDKSFLVAAEHPAGKHFITAREIQDIRHTCQLKANLVVLSACETGLGKEHEGGVIGLARAFQIAGANHILMSLWSINDQETATLIKLFFKYLQHGGKMLPHEAMRQAILEYKMDNDHPNYWASFSIFGLPMTTDSSHNKY